MVGKQGRHSGLSKRPFVTLRYDVTFPTSISCPTLFARKSPDHLYPPYAHLQMLSKGDRTPLPTDVPRRHWAVTPHLLTKVGTDYPATVPAIPPLTSQERPQEVEAAALLQI